MVTFKREEAGNWRQQVPGVRWFKADLHIHTMDDHRGRRAKMPSGITGPVESPDTISAYAKRFLQSAVENGVQVLGVTPHSPRIGTTADSSAVWQIVHEWNYGADDDGIPFREKIYALFPGFEPSLNDGKGGTHMLFCLTQRLDAKTISRPSTLSWGGGISVA